MGDRTFWLSRFIGLLSLLVAIATGTLRDLWWLWLLFWLTSEAGLAVSERLIYWQQQHIESLKESILLDAQLRSMPPGRPR